MFSKRSLLIRQYSAQYFRQKFFRLILKQTINTRIDNTSHKSIDKVCKQFITKTARLVHHLFVLGMSEVYKDFMCTFK